MNDMKKKLFLDSTQNQCCLNVRFYRWINVGKSTLNQRGYHVDRRRDVISTYMNVESTLSLCLVWHSQNSLFRYFQACPEAFSNIQQYSGILMDIKAYSGIFRHYWGVWSHKYTYSELCVDLAYTTRSNFEPWLI